MTPIQLTVPRPDPVADPNTITDPAELQRWLQALPVASPEHVAESILEALQLLTRNPELLPHRAELLEAYLRPLISLVAASRKESRAQYVKSSMRRRSRLTDLLHQVMDELSYNYKRLVNERVLGSAGTAPEEAALAVYRAIQSLSLDLVFVFAAYQREPRTAWREIIQLYQLAHEFGLHKVPVADPFHDSSEPSTINLAFKRILLINLLDPYKLLRGEVWAAYDYLGHAARKARLAKFRQPDSPSGCYLVDMDGAHKPLPFDPDHLPVQPERHLVLSIMPLNLLVHRQMQLVATQQGQIPGLTDLSKPHLLQLLRNMLLGWHVNPKRRHERLERYDWLMTACGVSAVCHYVGQGGIAAVGRPARLDAGEGEEEIDMGSLGGSDQVASHQTFRWRQVNFSASGVGMLLAPEESTALHVGQLVLMQSERGGTIRGKLGVVRRLIERDQSTIEAGIQFVGSDAVSGMIHVEEHGNDRGHPALLVERDGKPDFVITPQTLYRFDRRYRVERGDGGYRMIVARKLTESTCCFDRFEFEVVEAVGWPEPAPPPSAVGGPIIPADIDLGF